MPFRRVFKTVFKSTEKLGQFIREIDADFVADEYHAGMTATTTQTVVVEKENRLEITVPELHVGEVIEVTVVRKFKAKLTPAEKVAALEALRKVAGLTPEEGERRIREIRAEREARHDKLWPPT